MLVVIFQIHVVDFSICGIDTKRQSAISGDTEAPCALSVARECMDLPCRERAQFLGVLHVIEERQHLPKLVNRIGWNTLRDIFRVEPLQALMDEVPYLHLTDCSLLLNTSQATFAWRSALAGRCVAPRVATARFSWG